MTRYEQLRFEMLHSGTRINNDSFRKQDSMRGDMPLEIITEMVGLAPKNLKISNDNKHFYPTSREEYPSTEWPLDRSPCPNKPESSSDPDA